MVHDFFIFSFSLRLSFAKPSTFFSISDICFRSPSTLEQSQADFEEERYPPPKKRKSTTESASAPPGSAAAAAREVALPIAPASATTCQHCPTHVVAAQQQRAEIAELKARMADRDREQTQCSICLEKWHKYVRFKSAFMLKLPILARIFYALIFFD